MDIIAVINTLGFPIACVVACGWFIFKMTENQRTDTQSREERLYSQLDKFSTSLDNFNTTLIKIDTRLEAVEKELKAK